MTPRLLRRLKLIRRACVRVAGPESSCDPVDYRNVNGARGPLYSHCTPVALIVQAICGGELVSAHIGDEFHVWNRLSDGTDVDLTSDQFPGGDGWRPMAKGRRMELEDDVPVGWARFAAKAMAAMKE